jgi:hypothetical protein
MCTEQQQLFNPLGRPLAESHCHLPLLPNQPSTPRPTTHLHHLVQVTNSLGQQHVRPHRQRVAGLSARTRQQQQPTNQ